MVYNSFNRNIERKEKPFKSFFAVKNLVIDLPERKKYPNSKICSMIRWLNITCPLIWMLGAALSIDKRSIHFKGQHEDKNVSDAQQKEMVFRLTHCAKMVKISSVYEKQSGTTKVFDAKPVTTTFGCNVPD